MDRTKDKLFKVISKILNCDYNEIGLKSGLLCHHNWDSLAHISIIVGIEEEFDLDIPDDKIDELENVEMIYNFIVKNK